MRDGLVDVGQAFLWGRARLRHLHTVERRFRNKGREQEVPAKCRTTKRGDWGWGGGAGEMCMPAKAQVLSQRKGKARKQASLQIEGRMERQGRAPLGLV